VLVDGPMLSLGAIFDPTCESSEGSVPSVAVIKGLRSLACGQREGTGQETNRMAETRIEDDVLILYDDIVLDKGLVLDPKVIGEVAVKIESSTVVRKNRHRIVETNLTRTECERERIHRSPLRHDPTKADTSHQQRIPIHQWPDRSISSSHRSHR
jgi:hypothetical protein